jgi:hypothetical protein
MVTGKKGSSAGGRHGSHNTDKTDTAARDEAAVRASRGNPSDADTRAAATSAQSGLQEHTGEFRVGENIIFSMRNGDILIRRSPQGEEVTVSEATVAGLMVDAFFSDKLEGQYPTVTKQ